MATEFFAAISAGDTDTVRSLVTADPSLATATAPNGVSAILFALYNGKMDVADALQSSGAPLSLFDAAATGNAGRVRELLAETPALAKEWSADGFTALHYAAFFGGDVDVARALVTAGADATAHAQNPMLVAPLHCAVASRFDAITTMLVEEAPGVDVNARQQQGFTALMAVAQHGDSAMVDYLIDHGADPSLKTEGGDTAATIAEKAGHTDLSAHLQTLVAERTS